MRLWNYELISVLPRQQLLSQLRECVAISKDIYETGHTNHILINKIMDYDLQDFRDYCNLVIYEMMCNRGYNVSEKTINKLEKYINFNLDSSIAFDVENGKPLFKDWHDDRYLVICLYNIYEKFLCGGVTEDEWDKIYHKFYRYIDY